MSTVSLLLTRRGSQNHSSQNFSAGFRDNLAGRLGLALLSAVVSAVVAAVALGLSGAGGEQFGWEWAALWTVSLVTIFVTGRAVFALANFVAPAMSRAMERRRREQDDQRFLEFARRDSRLMADIDGAIRRSEWS